MPSEQMSKLGEGFKGGQPGRAGARPGEGPPYIPGARGRGGEHESLLPGPELAGDRGVLHLPVAVLGQIARLEAGPLKAGARSGPEDAQRAVVRGQVFDLHLIHDDVQVDGLGEGGRHAGGEVGPEILLPPVEVQVRDKFSLAGEKGGVHPLAGEEVLGAVREHAVEKFRGVGARDSELPAVGEVDERRPLAAGAVLPRGVAEIGGHPTAGGLPEIRSRRLVGGQKRGQFFSSRGVGNSASGS